MGDHPRASDQRRRADGVAALTFTPFHMSDGFTIDYSKFDRAIAFALTTSKKEPITFMKQQAKLVVRNLIEITPPAHANEGADVAVGKAARMAGESTIRRDNTGEANRWPHPKRRGIFVVLSDAVISKASRRPNGDTVLWAERDTGYLADATFFRGNASESEMMRHHDQYFQNGRMTSAGAYTRDIGRWKYIDQLIVSATAYKRFSKALNKRVGWMAAGWNQAAALLGYRPPAWIWRHSAPGYGTLTVDDQGVRIKMTNAVRYASQVGDMRRRVQYALDSQAKKMINTANKFFENMWKTSGFKLTS